MRAPRLAAMILALGLALAPAARAEDSGAATLVADSVRIAGNRTLIARGNVEVLYGEARLRAGAVSYDRTSGALTIEGPIVLTDDKGSVVLADSAQLSDDLRDGILTSARMVMDRQMQIAAAEIQRLGGRYTVLSRAVASSCEVCAKDPTPLWEIRARRVIHDQQERQIYFDNAQVRLAGVPVFWVPHLRMPDPTLTRATGFLMPSLVSTSRLGTGIQVPYFIRLGQSRDLTLTPFLASKDVRSLGIRYRQAFRTGEIALTGALSHDRVVTGRRGWLAAEGRFSLPDGFELRFAGETISDPAYFRDYGLSDKDRLQSSLVVSRTRPGEHIGGRLVHVHSIRSGEVNATLPQLSADVSWTRRLALPGLGGTATLSFESHAHRRSSDVNILGRDVARGTLSAFWRRDWVGPAGVLAAIETGATIDLHKISQDSTWPSQITTVTPAALVELRWPWARTDGAGNADVIEPVIQLVWSRLAPAANVPNEDSTLIEFDEGNLFGFSRFSGADRRERRDTRQCRAAMDAPERQRLECRRQRGARLPSVRHRPVHCGLGPCGAQVRLGDGAASCRAERHAVPGPRGVRRPPDPCARRNAPCGGAGPLRPGRRLAMGRGRCRGKSPDRYLGMGVRRTGQAVRQLERQGPGPP